MTEYPLFARNIDVVFKCPRCANTLTQHISNLPSPNWDGDTVETSRRDESYAFICPHCKLELETDVHANIYFGELQVHKLNDWKEIEVIGVEEREDDLSHVKSVQPRTDLDIFKTSGAVFQRHLESLGIYACYYSAKTGIPFCVEDIVVDRDDYRHDFLNGFLSALCSNHTSQSVYCLKVIPAYYFGSKVYFVCKIINEDIFAKYIIDESLYDFKKIRDYFSRGGAGRYIGNRSSFVEGFDMYQTSLNDDIFLYSLKCASDMKLYSIPINLLATNTPYYKIVEAYGYSIGLKQIVQEHFNCVFDTNENMIKEIKMDSYFTNYTQNALSRKYEDSNMYIDDLFSAIKIKIEDYSKLFRK